MERFQFALIGTLSALVLASPLAIQDKSPSSVYTREVSLPPVQMSQVELKQMIDRLRSLTERANGKEDGEGFRYKDETITLSGNNVSRQFDLQKTSLENVFAQFQRPAFDVSYSYQYSDGAISSILLELSDYRRLLRVRGGAEEQADALIGVVTEDMNNSRIFMGGRVFRGVGGVVLLIVGVMMLAAGGAKEWLGKLVSAAGLMLLLSLVALSWERWFPGVAIYPGTASWIERNDAKIGFWSFVFAIVSLLVSLARAEMLAKRTPDVASPTPSDTTEPS